MAPPDDPLYAYTGAFVDELWRAQIRHVVICPGSRSTPLALAFAMRQANFKLWMHVDERSAGYFALGLAKHTQQPVVLVCSSGTAAANFFPAVVEANLSHISLIVLTADRPPELRDNGAPQTIDQLRLYGTHVKWFSEIALPEGTPAALRYIRAQAARAAATARATPAGPVQLNMPFREPLVPKLELESHENSHKRIVYPQVAVADASVSLIDPLVIERLAEQLVAAQRGVIIAGPQQHGGLPEKLLALARTLGYPILADPLSWLRGFEDEQIITSYDAFLRDPAFVRAAPPEMIVRFGAMPTSKPLLQYIQSYAECPLVVIGDANTWDEPTQLASAIIRGSPPDACSALTATARAIMADAPPRREPNAWLARWRAANRATIAAIRAGIADFTEPFEGRVFTELAELLPEPATLFVGNSMPVRDCDTFFWGAAGVGIMGNRGANGIDGIISTALGVSAGQPDHPVVLVIGDLSFYHDMNGLLAAKLHHLNLTIVLVNNDGGGIFSFLPQADHPDHFEQLFGTPTGLDFAPAVAMYDGRFTRATDWAQFREAVAQGITSGGLHVVEVRTDRARNVAQHRALWQRVHAALIERGVIPPEGDEARG